MAGIDYICCRKCDVKLIYDGDRGNRKWWAERFGSEPEIECPKCKAEPAAVYRAGQAPGEVYHVQFFKDLNADEVLLYTSPPPRPWVGLTEEEFVEICEIAERGNYLVALQHIQEILKERNT